MKKMIFTIAFLAITGMAFAQQPNAPKTNEGQSKAAAQQAKTDPVGAHNTASKAKDYPVSKSSTSGLTGAVQKKANEARREAAKEKMNNNSSSSTSNNNTATTSSGKK